jgi:glycosyltransferase involved in cell wall biosynthesis
MPNWNSTLTLGKNADLAKEASPWTQGDLEVALLTGCQDRSYALGLAMALSSKGIRIDVIGNDRVDSAEFHTSPNLTFLNLGGIRQSEANFSTKLIQVLFYYLRLIRYVTFAKTKFIHILWNSKFEYFDRTLFMIYCKLRRKKIVLTAHNVNRGKRDSKDSILNRLTLRIQYRLADHIFVHTENMRSELVDDFGVRREAVTRIPFGMNIAALHTSLTPLAAKSKLGIHSWEKTILFFGRIAPYKGLEYLLTAFQKILSNHTDYRLIIAGEPMPGYEEYLERIHSILGQAGIQDRIIRKLEFISDEDTELYFKAADVLVLPYKEIFQSGVLFLGFGFGLPAITADVGSFREDIVQGQTGFLYEPRDSESLADTIEKYFASDLYKDLDRSRLEIRDRANTHHSWNTVGELTQKVYEELTVEKAERTAY